MKNQLRTSALTVAAILAIAFGTLCAPQPANALIVTMEVTWGGNTIPFDIVPMAELLMSDGTPLDPPVSARLSTLDNEFYLIGFLNVPSYVALVGYTWLDGGYNWDPDPGEEPTVELNWDGVTNLDATASNNGVWNPKSIPFDDFTPFSVECEFAYAMAQSHTNPYPTDSKVEVSDSFIAPAYCREFCEFRKSLG